MTTSALRIGIVGAGRIVRDEHIPRFRKIPGVELVAVSNRTPATTQAAAKAYGIPREIPDWRALVEDPDIDAVMIGAWPYLHGPVAIAAIEAGKHVLTEARMCTDGTVARQMLAASIAHPEVVAMVVPASFSLWADATIAALLGGGSIGTLHSVRVQWPSGPGDAGDHWRWERRYSGNNIMALGILYESMARWIGQATAVSAVLRHVDAFKPGPAGGLIRADVPDHALVIGEFPGGVTATIEMSAHQRYSGTLQALFFGSEGTLRVNLGAQAIDLATPGSEGRFEPVEVPAEDRADWTAEIDFVAAIRGERPVTLTDFDTAMRYMVFLDAVTEAAAAGRRVPIVA